jgi:3-methyl-2-oxobutanoate hydroxymethyltransferase
MADKVTVPKLAGMKKKGRKVVMVTCYDATFARLVDRTDVDAVLVGDSLGNVIQGHKTTLPVTLEDVIYHCRAVSRGLTKPLLVGDMPFLTYQVSTEEAIRNAGRLLSEGRAEAVKLEGGRRMADVVARLTGIGIPVMGHIGLTPQSVHEFGGYRIQGRSEEAARALLDDAAALEQAGVFSMVLEGIPSTLAAAISAKVSVPTIGIAAGPECDGQVLVLHDLLGLDEDFRPKFARRYAEMAGDVRDALNRFSEEVRAGDFPGPEHSFE